MTTANAPSPRSCSTGSATRPSRRAFAASFRGSRPARPVASSPLPATARSIVSPTCGMAPRLYRSPAGAERLVLLRRSAYATHYHANYVVPVLGPDTDRRMRSSAPYLLPLGRWLGASRRASRRLFGPRAARLRLRNAALAAESCNRNQPSSDSAEARRNSGRGSSRSAPRPGRECASNSKPRRKAAIEAPHEEYAKKVRRAPTILKWSLSNEAVARTKSRSGRAASLRNGRARLQR
jgi:hypothetical protein